MSKLALFDIDGTLLESNDFDAECYVEAVKRELGVERVDEDWSHYQFTTDAGILEEIYQKHFHQEIPRAVSERVKERFIEEMGKRLRQGNFQLEPVVGAAEAIREMGSSGDWSLAIATGAWKESAQLKLQNASLRLDRLCLFSCDDAVSRTGIMEIAMRSMMERAGGREFEKVAYVGDAAWDVKASRELGVAFLGMGKRWQELLSAGASHALRDYADKKLFLMALSECKKPKI